ncbi:aspartate/glutamate racemase family protein [Chengkuizengella axinellae]|uniref:Aspartate/glutamate racemase family protein n=1 Tax=Chengkuizengella axinellae TaxID=3064388 RepID=A0ABT9J771_9BACL|nr:aspartate/glutamate racemase family protein [Chengkuizengella sp. 2205SS18-9]MDP5276809.1 aspartate/glutamate racemase family protein [Chengkuizengella sp. 2205SS18-9]
MKTIGLLGGMSWESSAIYYKLINERVKEKLGGLHSAKSLMYSVDFEVIKNLQYEGKWDEATEEIINAAKQLEKGGADFIVICTNTMHKMATEVQDAISIPLLHIADLTGQQIQAKALKRVGLLATNFTMEHDFYKGKLQSNYDLEVLTPNDTDRKIVHDIIYDELCLGKVHENSKKQYLEIIEKLINNGAEGIILGCTEITMLVNEEDIHVPVFDTTKIHAIKSADIALEK